MNMANPQNLGARASGPLQQRDKTADRRSAHPDSHPGWHSRNYHPHLDAPGLIQHITFRLHDSLPVQLLDNWRVELQLLEGVPAADPRQIQLRERIAQYEDEGYGQCWLQNPRLAVLVEQALWRFDGGRYRLLEWCIMPNHVHVLIETMEGYPLPDIVHSWKTFTAREANKILGRKGRFWMADYFDRYIRNETHLAAVQAYIRENPVKAGLCSQAEEWQWSSASHRCAGFRPAPTTR
jgi:REP element-mobilizing transposase RayT